MSLTLQNFILFQAGWFSCVIGGASVDYHWVGIAVVTIVVALHLSRARNAALEAVLILLTTLLGSAWDSALMSAGLFSFSNGVVLTTLIPLWMVAMWALFATTLNVSMRWMKERYLLAAIFGATGGPLAYYAGYRLGAIEFGNTMYAMIAVGVGWMVIMPMLMFLSTRFNGYKAAQSKTYEVETV